MSGLSRGKQSQVIDKANESTSSDDDLIIISQFKPTENDNKQRTPAKKRISSRTRHDAGKPKKVQVKTIPEHEKLIFPKIAEEKVEVAKDEGVLPFVISPLVAASDFESVREDTLLALEEEIGHRLDEPIAESENPRPQRPVFCPFCWKKLNDKLIGMSHVKSCAKNLPTEKIFEAMQLHEKQVKEWEQIGLPYPGLQNNTKTGAVDGKASKPRANRGGGGGNSRKKKPATDPELELAMALSASLHEEFMERQQKEMNYLADIGLEKEVATKMGTKKLESEQESKNSVDDAHTQFRVRFSKPAKTKLQKSKTAPIAISPPSLEVATTASRKRGKSKATLKSTKLFTTSDAEKAALISEKVSNILEHNEKVIAENQDFHKLHDENADYILWGINERLNVYRDKEHQLWKMSTDMQLVPDNQFYTDALMNCKAKIEPRESIIKTGRADEEEQPPESEGKFDTTILLLSPVKPITLTQIEVLAISQTEKLNSCVTEEIEGKFDMSTSFAEMDKETHDPELETETNLEQMFETETLSQPKQSTETETSVLFLDQIENQNQEQEHDNYENHDFNDWNCNWSNNNIDDSLFANLPDEFLESNPTPNCSNNVANAAIDTDSPDIIPGTPPELATQISKKGPSYKKSPKKSKSKSKKDSNNYQKIYSSSQPLHQRNSASEENLASPSFICSTPKNSVQSQQNPRRNEANQSPLLNYSTIDTPILKQELKRYGLKPLPRSKAKVLLRHIYKETH